MYSKTLVGPHDGLVYLKRINGMSDTVYDVLLTRDEAYFITEEDKLMFTLACLGAVGANKSPIFYHGLIKHGQPEKLAGGFYPIPLVFAPKEKREAKDRKDLTPAIAETRKRWLFNKRLSILKVLGVDSESALAISNMLESEVGSEDFVKGMCIVRSLTEQLVGKLYHEHGVDVKINRNLQKMFDWIPKADPSFLKSALAYARSLFPNTV